MNAFLWKVYHEIVGDIMRQKARLIATLASAIEKSKERIDEQSFLNIARKRAQDFTMNRKMPFDKLVLFMVNMVKSSAQTCLDRFFDLTGQENAHMTQQSFSEARQNSSTL